MSDKTKWGILGLGNIARKFAEGLSVLPDAELVAVGSRSKENAEKFGNEYKALHRHPSYEALANDADVDAVYVATPHTFHKENSLLCLKAGKAVLCEKPFTINATEAEEVISYARKNKLFLMEAMWTRYLPVMVKLREILDDGVIGEVRMIKCSFGFRTGSGPKSRLFDPDLGGGGLLDVGVYTVSYVSMILGTPSRITGMAEIGKTGVDEQCAVILGYKNGQLALLSSAVRTLTPHDAIIMGTAGRITIPDFWHGEKLILTLYDGDEKTIDVPFEGNGYNYEAVEVMNCLQQGKLESEIMPLDETLSIMKTMDKIRAQWGLKYPME